MMKDTQNERGKFPNNSTRNLIGSTSKGRRHHFHDAFPSHLGKRFVDDLSDLVDKLIDIYDDPKSRYLKEHLLSKYLDPRVVSPAERRDAAIAKWLETEHRNLRTSMRLYFSHDIDLGWVTLDELYSTARKYIRRCLADFDYDTIMCLGGHSNGASTRIRRSPQGFARKFTGEAHVSSSALPHWDRCTVSTALEDQMVEPFESSVMFTVDKKSDIDRVACKEPECNMLLQRAAGKYIRSRLQRVGINLRDQTANQRLAKRALSEDLATVDLSAASDSVTTLLVQKLLPWEYYCLLDDLRVKQTILPDGTDHELCMFSSMGNGFTFELESLLFWALTCATNFHRGIKGKVSVYGDDIITPSAAIPYLRNVLGVSGFSLNTTKSCFGDNPLRESCGKHYYNGSDVTPFYIRAPITTMTQVIRALNQLLAWDSIDPNQPYFWTKEVAEFHRKWAHHVPQCLHGGLDTSSSTSLVTDNYGALEIDLQPLQRKRGSLSEVKTLDHGRLSQWLVSTHCRSADFLPEPGDCYNTQLFRTGSPRLRKKSKWDKPKPRHDIYWLYSPVYRGR